MKLKYILSLAMGLAAARASAQDKKLIASLPAPTVPAVPTPPSFPDKDKFSYAIGVNFGNWMKQNKMEVDVNTIAAAMTDTLNGTAPRLSDAEMSQIMNNWKMAARYKRDVEVKERVEAGDKFRENFAKEEGVKKTADGLEYKVLAEGAGDTAKAGDTVRMKYKGTLIDGTEFDHSDSFMTRVTGVIPGWTEMMQLMKPGAKVHVVIPPQLGYGPNGQAPKIPPMTTLVFDMEMISIQPPPPAPAPHAAANPGPASGPSQNQVVSGEIIKVPSAEELKKGAKIEVIKAEDIKDGKAPPPK